MPTTQDDYLPIPFNDTARTANTHSEKLLDCIGDVALNGRWLMGNYNRRFAKAFAEYCGAQYCLPVANGSDALELSLRAVLGENTAEAQVITVANAGGYTSAACRLVGATPVYVDIDINSQLVCLSCIEQALEPEVKAIVITHLYGGVVDVPAVRALLTERGRSDIAIIEDCAQAHGASLGRGRVGNFGDLATFSFYPTKNLGAMGDGGAIVTSNEALLKTLSALHQYGWEKKYQVATRYGRNSRMDEMQAAIVLQLLPHLDGWNNRRRDIYQRYREATSRGIDFLVHQCDFVAHLAVVRTQHRDEFMAFMKDRKIAVDIHYPVLDTDQEAWFELPQRQVGGLSASRASAVQVISLPCFPTLYDSEVERVCLALRDWGSC